MSNSILIVEDEPAQRDLVRQMLQGDGFEVVAAATAEEAILLLEKRGFDLVISDWKLPGMDGVTFLAWVKENSPETAAIMVTAYGTISHAVTAVQNGADDYLAKPFEHQALLLAVNKSLQTRSLKQENLRLSEALEERDRLVDLVGKSASMQKLYRRIEKIAGTDATVLLSGESGTGKELVARALHALSRRDLKPFVAVNCAAIPHDLMEAEILGAEKGAYTGATRRRPGKFELAHGGTLFLDEIGELPLTVQPKLLRVLQEGSLTRLGGETEIETNVRVIAASNKDLEEEVAEGRFREDLFYRLNVVPIALPPLRQRREDIPMLVDHFIGRARRQHGIDVNPFPKALQKRLIDDPWLGNVRELGNVVERLVLLADNGHVDPADMPTRTQRVDSVGFSLPLAGIVWEEFERSALAQALELAGGNRSRAAKLLALPYKAFLYRLEKFGL